MDSVSKREIWFCNSPRGVSGTPLSARTLTLRDLNQVKTLAEKCFSKRWSENDYQYFLTSESSRSYGLLDEGTLVFYVLSLVAQGDLDLVSIATDPLYQRKGLARWGLNCMEQMKDLKRIFLEVDETNASAIALYASAGFKEYGKRKKYYEGLRDAILMRKTF